MENRKLNLILGLVSALLLFFTVYILYTIKNNEQNKIMFDVNEIKNISYSSENNKFYTDGINYTLVLNDNTLVNNRSLSLNKETGELIKDLFYIRNINERFIIVWYDKSEYKLYR